MQELIVIAAVAYAAVAVVFRYAPKALKRQAQAAIASRLSSMGLHGFAGLLSRRASRQECSDGCGSCNGCGPRPAVVAQGGRGVIPIKPQGKTTGAKPAN